MVNELRPLALRREGHPRVSIARKINEIKIAVYTIEVDRLRATGCITGERQPAFPCKCIDQTGFADVASTQKRYLGQPVGGELLGTTGTVDEFCCQFYYTGRVGGRKRVVNNSIPCFRRFVCSAGLLTQALRSPAPRPATALWRNWQDPASCARRPMSRSAAESRSTAQSGKRFERV